MPLPQKVSILKRPRRRSAKLDLSGYRSRAFIKRRLMLISRARILAGKRKFEPFLKKRKRSAEARLKRRV